MTSANPWKEIRRALQRPYVVLDTETTGLLNPEIVSIAVVGPQGETILDRRVRPGKPIDPSAAAITGIDDEAVATAPAFPSIEPLVTTALEGQLVAIYNAEFDLSALRNTYARYGLPLPAFEPFCVMRWFARLYGEWNPRRNDFVWKPLSTAAAHFRVEQAAAHDALDDAHTTWRVIQQALRFAGEPLGGMESLFEDLPPC